MGFWKTFWAYATNTEPNEQGFPQPTRPAPPMPTIKVPKKDISEPVLSIIQTLKDGEWSFEGSSYSRTESVYFTHEWFGRKLTIYFWHHADKPQCDSEWMTQDEKEAVGSVCWEIYQGRVKWEKEQSLAKQRESFMCLVKE